TLLQFSILFSGSSVTSLLFKCRCFPELEESKYGNGQSHDDCNRSSHIVIICFKSQFVHPGNQYIRPSRILTANGRIPFVKQIDDIEVIEVLGILHNKQWRRCKHEMWKGDVPELLPSRSSINIGRLIHVLWHTLQDTCKQRKHKRKTEPCLNHDQSRLCPEWVG